MGRMTLAHDCWLSLPDAGTGGTLVTRSIVSIFPRNKYKGGTTALVYYPRDRQGVAAILGSATKCTFHARVYDRASGGVLDFVASHGCLSDEPPAEALRLFTLTLSGQTPTLPWNATNMTAVPDDGTFYIQPTMGLSEISAQVSGGSGVWVEFEMWATVEVSQ
jgi:hypothetical protein